MIGIILTVFLIIMGIVLIILGVTHLVDWDEMAIGIGIFALGYGIIFLIIFIDFEGGFGYRPPCPTCGSLGKQISSMNEYNCPYLTCSIEGEHYLYHCENCSDFWITQ